jgi:hypothetical protein
MAKKAFEIQGSDLSLGGVNLQAGTTGVVIPGVTEAANYKVEEVEDVDEQIDTLEGAVAILDAVQFAALSADPNADISGYATYTVELDDDYYIDDIEVTSSGTYTQQQATTNAGSDMWAPGVSGDPFASFNPAEWFQVPFRPKMRADEVTTIGGGGSGSRVKLESPGDRRIEEVYGYKEVSVTGETIGSEVTTTVYDSNAGSEWQLWVPTTAELTAAANSGLLHNILVSGDQINYYNAIIGTNNLDYTQLLLRNDILLAVDQGQTVYYKIATGGDPVVWWDSAELPGGSTDFRGAIIDYHAYTGESTIIGTIHIVDDSGEEHISHTEVQSGSTDGENDDLWLVTQEGQIKYRRIDRESKTLKVQWSAKVFYGSEFWD